MSSPQRRSELKKLWEAEQIARTEALDTAIADHDATPHIDEMNKFLRSCSDLTNQDFFNKSIAEALIYLLEHVREEGMPK
jgi:hypothetical protein